MRDLRELYLGDNELTSLPDWFGNLINIKELQLGGNNLVNLPNCMQKLVDLEILYLNGCNLHFLPDWIGDLKNLKSLEIENNHIPILPESFRNLKNLKYFRLENAGLRSFSNIPEKFYDSLDFEDIWPFPAFPSPGNHLSKDAIDNFKDRYNLYYYYLISPLELAAKYAKDQNSLTSQEKDRLAWEGGHRERQLMEECGVLPNDPILAEINKRLSISYDNGLKLIK